MVIQLVRLSLAFYVENIFFCSLDLIEISGSVQIHIKNAPPNKYHVLFKKSKIQFKLHFILFLFSSNFTRL